METTIRCNLKKKTLFYYFAKIKNYSLTNFMRCILGYI